MDYIENGWLSSELDHHFSFLYHLSDCELKELDTALKGLNTLDLSKIDKSVFPLPSLSNKIKTIWLEQLENGIGTLLIRGINLAKYTQAELNALFFGLGLYFGTPVYQTNEGQLLHRVEDAGYKRNDKKARGTNTNLGICFHNDPCDIAALFCIRKAKKGGASRVASSIAIHNYLLKYEPDLLRQLYGPYYTLRHQSNKMQESDYTVRPIFAVEKGYFTCNILRRYIDLAQTHPDVPRMTSEQIKALDVFEELAFSPEFCYHFYLEAGDIWLVNNYTTIHTRDKFVDYEDSDKRRLLLRLWLSVENSRPLPLSYKALYHCVEPGAVRGGYQIKKTGAEDIYSTK